MQLIPNREIGFGFVSCSCRACVRACVRSCVGVRGHVLLIAGGPNARMSWSGAASPRFPLGLVPCSAQGF